jgi:hypothetical protein
MAITEHALAGLGLSLFTRYLGKLADEARALCEATLAEFKRKDVHVYNSQ